jgi:hypothetical protein
VGVKNCRWGKGTGNREQGTGKRVLSDFTFLHIPLNFSVHLLSRVRYPEANTPYLVNILFLSKINSTFWQQIKISVFPVFPD